MAAVMCFFNLFSSDQIVLFRYVASAQFVLSHLPKFNAISGVSLAAAVMSFSYCTIAWAACLKHGIVDNVDDNYRNSQSRDRK
ncbi:hypothetical protein K1719_010372 [Acacia pycnantha]|nr:hypothetical protein K1719_010372 [Acacia pycnantha]